MGLNPIYWSFFPLLIKSTRVVTNATHTTTKTEIIMIPLLQFTKGCTMCSMFSYLIMIKGID